MPSTRRRPLIVLDASAAAELTLGRGAAASIEALIRDDSLRVPVHFDAEVYATVRKLLQRREVTEVAAVKALFRLRTIRVQRIAIAPLVAEAFALRDRFSPYDAFYAIVARVSDAVLVTCDRRLARAAVGYCRIQHLTLR